MTRLLAAVGALALLAAAGPALASDPVPVHGACAAPAGAIVVTPDTDAVERDVATPVGALGLAQTQVGDVYVDLAGRPAASTADLVLTLSFDNPVADYDLVTDGNNDLSTDAPETKLLTVAHCSPVAVAVEVFTGLPVDALTLATSATETSAE